ncbi:MAG: Mini-ribonuclease 3 [Clostridia bacterium]|nr:Mini-ribonuclease 3 [Clostridia bacterium]
MIMNEGFIDGNAIQKNALTLAFIGDAVFERYVRELAVYMIPGAKVRKLHVVCAAAVNCRSQSEILTKLEKELREDELSVVRRGMNSKPHSIPKHADIDDYLRATGFEALLGYLELSGNPERLSEILASCRESVEEYINGANK